MRYLFDNFLLDTAEFSLFRAGKRVEIGPEVLRFLIYLIENRDRVISRAELLDKLFRHRLVTDNALTVRIRAARRAVGDTGDAQSVIATFHGYGYRFVANVKTTSSRLLPDTDDRRQPEVEGSGPLNVPTRLSGQPSIAILPFEVITGHESHYTIARGLAHDIITRVAYCRTMFVIARGSSFQFPSGQQDVGEVGKVLGARYVCQGAVQISGDRVRVSLGLADTKTRGELWAHQFDKRLMDILNVQEEIAAAIAASLEYEVQRNEMRLASLLPSTNLNSWSAFHRGLDHMYRFRSGECDEAEYYFRRSIELEPGLARPYAGLSFVNYERAYLNLDGKREKWLQRSFDQAQQAVNADSMDPMGHWALSRAFTLARDLESARKVILRATELNPSYASAQYFLGWISLQLGDRAVCHERVDLAMRLSPRDPLIYGMQGIASMNLALMGRDQEAAALAQSALLHPDVHYQARAMAVAIFSIAGRTDLAGDQLKLVRAIDPGYSAEDFFSVYAFQHAPDIEQIKHGFSEASRAIS
jgi:TolB-like protein